MRAIVKGNPSEYIHVVGSGTLQDYGFHPGGSEIQVSEQDAHTPVLKVEHSDKKQNSRKPAALKVITFAEPCAHRSPTTSTTYKKSCVSVKVELAHCDYFDTECSSAAAQPSRKGKTENCAECTVVNDSHTFVWPYIHSSGGADELRWSIRSVLKHYSRESKIIVLGEKPSWYGGTFHEKTRSRGRFVDVLEKLQLLASLDDCPEDFTWMMDDVYFIRPITNAWLHKHWTVTSHFQNRLDKWRTKNGWARRKKRTSQYLLDIGISPVYDYATHMPYTLRRDNLRQMLSEHPVVENELIWETVYGNLFWSRTGWYGTQIARSCNPLTYKQWAQKAQNATILNNGAGAWNKALRQFLFERFPDDSPIELSSANP